MREPFDAIRDMLEPRPRENDEQWLDSEDRHQDLFWELYRDSSAGVCFDGDSHHKQLLWCYPSWNPSQNFETPGLQPSKEPSTKPSRNHTPDLSICMPTSHFRSTSFWCREPPQDHFISFQYWSSHFEMLRIDNSRTSLNNSSSKSTLPQVLCRAAETNLLPSISNHFCSDSDRTGSDGAKAKVRIISNVASRCHWDKALPCARFFRCDNECFLVSAKVCF